MGTELNVVTSRLHFTVKISLLTCNIKVSSSLLCDNTAIHCTNICPLVSYLHLTDNQKECSSLPVSHDPPLFFILALLHHPTQDGGRPQWIIPPLFHFLPKYSRFRGDTVCQLAGQSHLVSNTDNHQFDADGDRHFTCKEEVGANALAFPTSVILPWTGESHMC